MTKQQLFEFIDKNVSGLRNRAIIKDAIEDLDNEKNQEIEYCKTKLSDCEKIVGKMGREGTIL